MFAPTGECVTVSHIRAEEIPSDGLLSGVDSMNRTRGYCGYLPDNPVDTIEYFRNKWGLDVSRADLTAMVRVGFVERPSRVEEVVPVSMLAG